MMIRLYLILFTGVFLLGMIRPSLALDWSDHAKRFTGESDFVKQQAILEIKKIPHLEQSLRSSLWGEKKFLALDVISNLKLIQLLPDLIQLSETDESGYSYHAINSLMNSENRKEVSTLYRQRLFSKTTSIASKLALLDTLARLQSLLREAELNDLLQDSNFKIQSGALSYLRYAILKLGQTDYLPLLSKFIARKTPYQLKLQALFLISELHPKLRRSLLSDLRSCQTDFHPEVKNFCIKLLDLSR